MESLDIVKCFGQPQEYASISCLAGRRVRQPHQPDGRFLVRNCDPGCNVAPPSSKVFGPFEIVTFFGLEVACDRLLH